ncbi:hypothetical protein PENSPDRAFT_671333 [Peniophora sp. CONT]|nr:hypothetical protein PENSPDRAFT_671333 [Peniophora sp. CONT]
MLYDKIKSLQRLLTGPPFEFTRLVQHPRSEFGIPGMNGVNLHSANLLGMKLRGAIAVERSLVRDIQRCLGLAALDLEEIDADMIKVLINSSLSHPGSSLSAFGSSGRIPKVSDMSSLHEKACLNLEDQRSRDGTGVFRCPSEGCPQLLWVAPTEIAVASALAKAIYAVTCTGGELSSWSTTVPPSLNTFFE